MRRRPLRWIDSSGGCQPPCEKPRQPPDDSIHLSGRRPPSPPGQPPAGSAGPPGSLDEATAGVSAAAPLDPPPRREPPQCSAPRPSAQDAESPWADMLSGQVTPRTPGRPTLGFHRGTLAQTFVPSAPPTPADPDSRAHPFDMRTNAQMDRERATLMGPTGNRRLGVPHGPPPPQPSHGASTEVDPWRDDGQDAQRPSLAQTFAEVLPRVTFVSQPPDVPGPGLATALVAHYASESGGSRRPAADSQAEARRAGSRQGRSGDGQGRDQDWSWTSSRRDGEGRDPDWSWTYSPWHRWHSTSQTSWRGWDLRSIHSTLVLFFFRFSKIKLQTKQRRFKFLSL